MHAAWTVTKRLLLGSAAAGMLIAGAALLLAAADSGQQTLESELKLTARALIGEQIKGKGEAVLGKHGWILLTSELRYLSTGPFWGAAATTANPSVKPELVDPIPAIVDFHQQLQERGIELYFVLVPIRELVYPESVLGTGKIPAQSTPPYLHSLQRQFLEELRTRGIRAVDLLPLFLEHRRDERGPLYCPSDPHWTGYAVSLAAKELAGQMISNPWYRKAPKTKLSAEWQSYNHDGVLYRQLRGHVGHLPEHDTVQIRRVTLASGEELDRRYPDSPVVLTGDSNTIWWGNLSAGLAHQLAYELSIPVDLLSLNGGGATNARVNLVRTIRSEPGYLDGKKVVVWCFTARALVNTHEGWRKLSLEPPPA